EADSVRSVCPPSQNPFKMWRLNGGYLKPLVDSSIPESYNMPRQRLPQAYWQNGYVDVAWHRTIMGKSSMTGTKILPLILDPENIIDMDSLLSFQMAELILSQRG
ncbi:MAG: acylneuraminate cytidylyltransferase family protein, partial [Dehalococcoidia bacterium]